MVILEVLKQTIEKTTMCRCLETLRKKSFEDTKVVIRSRNSKDRQKQWPTEKYKQRCIKHYTENKDREQVHSEHIVDSTQAPVDRAIRTKNSSCYHFAGYIFFGSFGGDICETNIDP